MSQITRSILAGLVVLPAALLYAQKNSSINVTTTIYDSNGLTQLLTRSDDYNGNGLATYTSTTKGQAVVTSQIDSNGNWSLYWTTPRSVWLSLDQPVGSQPPSAVPIPSSGYYTGQAHGLCGTRFQSLGMGITYNCQAGVEFHYAGNVYKLAMGPALPWGGPSTGVAAVVCNSISNNQCVNWTISSAPDANGQNANVANLYYYTNNNWVFLGQYADSLLIRVTNP